MDIKPTSGNVIVQMIEEEGITRNGLFLTAGAKKIPTFAWVIAACKGSPVRVGDKVVLERYAGKKIVIDRDTEYLSVRENQIMAIAEDD